MVTSTVSSPRPRGRRRPPTSTARESARVSWRRLERARLLGLLGALALAGCDDEPILEACQGSEPVVVTGLSGLLDGQPVVEIQALDPVTCAPIGESVWMFFDDPTSEATLGGEPSGVLARGEVEVTDTSIFFRSLNVGVRLLYPGDAGVAPELRLEWFSGRDTLAVVECAADPFTCQVVE
jgi:hypothetical protein